jgi:glycosyltransferase involved in cell wall biosynthesis
LAESTRVLHICPRHSFSGLEAWVIEMILEQKSRGLTAELVVLDGSPMQKVAQNANIKIHVANSNSQGFFGFLQLTKIVRNACRELQPHILHLHNSQDFKALGPWLALKRGSFKTILQLHIWISHPKRDPLHLWLYRNLDELWCSSEPARASLLKLLPITNKQIRIIHYGRPLQSMEPRFFDRAKARTELGLPAQALVVGTVSRIDKGKGSGELVDGSVELMRANSDLHLVLIGAPTDDPQAIDFAATLKKRTEALPESVRSRIHWLGLIKDSFRYLKALDIFVLPTYRECFSLALLEAQLASLPCLVTNAGGSPELVQEGKTGWLCEPESTASFQQTLARAIEAKSDWARFGETAQARVRAEFDSKSALGETLEGYQRLLSK